jgi:hypothetical protein
MTRKTGDHFLKLIDFVKTRQIIANYATSIEVTAFLNKDGEDKICNGLIKQIDSKKLLFEKNSIYIEHENAVHRREV